MSNPNGENLVDRWRSSTEVDPPPLPNRPISTRSGSLGPAISLGALGLVAAVVLGGGVILSMAGTPTSAPTITAPPVTLELLGPGQLVHDNGLDTAWYGLDVRFCNRSSGYFTYLPTNAALVFADGRRTGATNGHGRGPRTPGTPSWLSDIEGWMDKATLSPGECVSGWLAFYTVSSSEPVRLEWHGLTLDVAAAFGTAVSTPASAPSRQA